MNRQHAIRASIRRRVATAASLLWLCAPCGFAATLDVNTTLDVVAVDGACSLREAITAVNLHAASGNMTGECAAGDGADDTILVPAGTYTLSITGVDEDNNASGDLDIRTDMTIQGAGLGATTIDANGVDRVFDLPVGGISMAIRDLTVANGHAPDGSGSTGESGGAISNANGAQVSLTRVELGFNRAGKGANSFSGFGGGAGGAIYSSGGSLLLLTCSLHDNASGSGGSANIGGFPGSGGNGGAVSAFNTAIGVELTSFDHNQTGNGGAGGLSPSSPGFGGGIYANGGSLSILRSAFDGNQTSSLANGGSGAGGGVFVYNVASNFGESSFTRNSAFDGGGVQSGDSALTLRNVTLSGNYAGQFGGGLFVFGGSAQLDFVTISANQAAIDSGATRIEYGNSGAAAVAYRNSIISGNSAPSLPDCNVDTANGNTLTSQGYNIAGDSCPATADGDVATTNPRLSPLGDNGGVGLTQVPQPSGPATDAGNCLASVVTTDQRGHSRFVDVPRAANAADACDIGAVELDDDIFWDGFGN